MTKKQDLNVWYGRIEDAEKYPDVRYWQAQSDEKKFEAAWQMVIEAYAIKGVDLRESRLQRSVASFQRKRR